MSIVLLLHLEPVGKYNVTIVTLLQYAVKVRPVMECVVEYGLSIALLLYLEGVGEDLSSTLVGVFG